MPDLGGYGWMLWEGLRVTVLVALASMLLALLLGLIGAWGKLSSSPLARGVAGVYTTVVRGVPELVLLLLIFYGVPTLIQDFSQALGYPLRVDFNSFIAGICTIGFIYGAFTTEVYRGAFQSIPKGHIEAARACGMSRTLTLRRVILPQMWRFALPGLGNVWMVLIKATAIISIIQLDELMRMADIAARATRLPFTFYFIASLMYLGLTILSMLAQQRLETWANRGVRRA